MSFLTRVGVIAVAENLSSRYTTPARGGQQGSPSSSDDNNIPPHKRARNSPPPSPPPRERIFLLPAGTTIEANESVESAKLIQGVLDYATEGDGCLQLIPANFEVLADPEREPQLITLDLQDSWRSQLMKAKGGRAESMTTTGIWHFESADDHSGVEKGDTLWYFKGDRCVASALVENKGKELEVHLLCASRRNGIILKSQGYGTNLLAAIGAHYNLPMTLNSLPKALSFYKKLGFRLHNPDEPDVLHLILKHPWSLMARVKRIPPQPQGLS